MTADATRLTCSHYSLAIIIKPHLLALLRRAQFSVLFRIILINHLLNIPFIFAGLYSTVLFFAFVNHCSPILRSCFSATLLLLQLTSSSSYNPTHRVSSSSLPRLLVLRPTYLHQLHRHSLHLALPYSAFYKVPHPSLHLTFPCLFLPPPQHHRQLPLLLWLKRLGTWLPRSFLPVSKCSPLAVISCRPASV